jgi:hypothetical protein
VLNPRKAASEAPIIGMAILLLSFVPMCSGRTSLNCRGSHGNWW